MKAIILAAGKGTRFRAEKVKVLHEILNKSLIQYMVELADAVGAQEKIVIVGYQGDEVIKSLQHIPNLRFVWQREQKGTGHAVMMAVPLLQNDSGDALILYSDVPGLRKETITAFLEEQQRTKNVLTILTAVLPDPKWYGRILKDKKGKVLGIREAKDCTEEELKIKEINSGIMVVKIPFLLQALKQLTDQNGQHEYYLTDIVGIACKEKKKVGTFQITDPDEIKGVNSLEELEEMGRILKGRG